MTNILSEYAKQDLTRTDIWLDDYAGPEYQGEDGPNFAQDWARIAKIAEETGEAIQAFIGATGQNPRKGYTHTMPDVLDELADVVFTALCAIQHFTKNADATDEILVRRLQRISSRITVNPHA